ncbi:2-hydroxyacyl-CoA dehydratase subunit D [Chloroflexota bacterium]
MSNEVMEARLRSLIEMNSEANRAKPAMEWKRQGKKVIGVLTPYVPEEVISAAGMLPWRISGTWRSSVPKALVYRPPHTCQFSTHVLESLLSGELDFLDGVVANNYDDDRRRVWDVWVHLGKTPFAHIMHLPFVDTGQAREWFVGSINKLIKDLEDHYGVKISPESLRRAIDVQNKTRTLLRGIYELRKREIPPLSGSEFLGITTAASIMPREEFNREIEALSEYIEQRQTSLKKTRPRLLVASDALDNPAYLELIENAGCLVAMDDFDTGSRYIWKTVQVDHDDPVQALARDYLVRPACPRMFYWADRQMEQVIAWVREFDIGGVLNFVQIYGYPRWLAAPYLSERLMKAGIPNMTLLHEYHVSNQAQLKTRITAFLETLKSES